MRILKHCCVSMGQNNEINKDPTAYGTDGEYRTKRTKFEHLPMGHLRWSIQHPASRIEYPTLAHFRHFSSL